MNAQRMGWSAVTALSLAMLGSSAHVTLGQNDPQGETVPRAEYEDLRSDLESVERRLEELEAAPPATRPAEVERDRNRRSGLNLAFGERPNWEKHEDWMTPAFRTTQMDLLIGQSQEIDLYMGLQTTGRAQWFEQSDVSISGVEVDSLDPGFQTAWGDIAFLADIADGKMLIFFDLYISSRPHPSTTYGNEGYMLIRELPDDSGISNFFNGTLFKYVNVKAGHFEIDYGDFHYRRSDNAWVQRNALIGNTLIDPDVEEIGMELFSKESSPINWLVGISSGTTTENLNEGRGIASVHGKLWRNWADDFRTSVSGYYVDHSDNPNTGPGATKGSLFSGRRSGGPYGAVFGGGNSPGEITINADQRVTAFQLDSSYTPGPWELYGHVGWMEDADPNGSLPGSLENSWTYGAAEAVYYFTPRLYGAGRYSFAMANEIDGQSSDGMAHRIQLGGGYWLTRNFLFKLEGVYQTYGDFDEADGLVGGVDAFEDPSFYGVIVELSFAF